MLKQLSDFDVLEVLKEKRNGLPYSAFYSSWLGGITCNPNLMLVPLDDHLVHRGDGVFEAMKFLSQRIYLLAEHLERLEISSVRLGIPLPASKEQIASICSEVILRSQLQKGLLRVFVSRGPGGFSTNPYESKSSQLYIVATHLLEIPESQYQNGASLAKSMWAAKAPWYAQVKSCNYLQNVMMKKEAVDRGYDFTVAFTEAGLLAEGSTENVLVLTQEGALVRPPEEFILKGTTMMRVFHFAQKLVMKGQIVCMEERPLHEEDLLRAKEVFLTGTTLDVLPISKYEHHVYTDFRIAHQLREDLLLDQGRSPHLNTLVD